MAKKYAIIDLFAGPGGLGEGFSRAGQEAEAKARIHLSIEMEPHAVQTLRLRSFLRSFETVPREYHDALNAGHGLPDWKELYPSNWEQANAEVRQRVLGQEGVFEELAVELDRARETYHGDTILIGGPPCQAYSLAGRSRNKGKQGYIPEDDDRHYLYREYVRILNRLEPSVFIMENVKGMLSSRVDGGGIFSRVLDDLEAAGEHGYRLLPLATTPPANGERADGRDFLIRAEEHGVPQARHRVIVLGIRNDIPIPTIDVPLLGEPQVPVTVSEAIDDLLRLRSGLSRKDSASAWHDAVHEQAERIARDKAIETDIRHIARDVANADSRPEFRTARTRGNGEFLPNHLRDWLLDDTLAVTLHHETRGHIPADLGRYLFSAAYSRVHDRAPKLSQFPEFLQPEHRNRSSGDFADRFRTQVATRPSTTVTSHISKDGHYFIHPDPGQCRSLTVREAARLQTFPDNYFFCGPRTMQYHQVGNAVPPYLAYQIAKAVLRLVG
ncbi:DNA cytosine methyltransferase [Paracoccus seriniphilus]|uniref:DNA (cytosine-5-)-methyltransferase n=1 Tax=Paracoccus seriniphilus TaxID=184748 RepID=A0A239PMF4_9RHOB|nr:DNA cytosine methyltransferase [Paracoccus seriniphilus]WCR13467.1 DNA cytosine methyltransferase [Paracoccus seriniphilus]SNT68956.1 DNA (cytosine-5)-methyltransferase 1 [Paracoccus seriniphilus]